MRRRLATLVLVTAVAATPGLTGAALAGSPVRGGIAAKQVLNAATDYGARGVDWSTMDTNPLASSSEVLARQILLNANQYALRVWWPRQGAHLMSELTPHSTATDDPERQLAMEAYSLSVSLGTGAMAGAGERTIAQSVVATIVNRLVLAHRTTTPGGWGGSWQSSMWASLIERAAMMQWQAIDEATKERLVELAAYEADYILDTPVRYLRDAHGKVLTPGNSGAEEDSWFALATATAAAMLPDHPNRAAWDHKTVDLMLAAWARQGDVTSNTVVNGAPVSKWLQGSNVEDNGAVINHGRVAPDYSTTTYQNVDVALTNSLLGMPTPSAAMWSLPVLYGAMSANAYKHPPYDAPGGASYRSTTSQVYYPQGCDWGQGQMDPYALMDTQAAAFNLGSRAKVSASTMQSWHLNGQLYMQDRFPDRHTYLNSSEYDYVGREAHVAQLAAQTYLTMFVHERDLYHATSANYWSPTYAAAYDKAATSSVVPALAERSLMTP